MEKHKESALESVVSNGIGFLYTILLQLFFSSQPFWKSVVFSTILLVLNIIRGYIVSMFFKEEVQEPPSSKPS